MSDCEGWKMDAALEIVEITSAHVRIPCTEPNAIAWIIHKHYTAWIAGEKERKDAPQPTSEDE